MVLSVLVLAFVLAVLFGLFGIVERRWPAIPEQRRWRDGLGTDVAYWFFIALIGKAITRASVITALLAMAVLWRVPLDREHLQAFATSTTVLASQPRALQILEVMVLADLIGYGMHRLFHRGRLWRFHAVHHASTDLDWLSSVRLHPVNEALGRLAQVIPLFVLGFEPGILAAYVPFLTLYALLLHANVPWTFGPLRYVISSPAFHRWHHTSLAEGRDKNFAGLFPWIDLVFGTFYMPAGVIPREFGAPDSGVPQGLLRQMAYPFTPLARSGAGVIARSR